MKHIEEIVKLYNSGRTGPEIAKQLNVGSTTVYRALKKAGVKPQDLCRTGNRKGARKFTIEQEIDIVKKYQNGCSLSSLMEECKLSNWTTVRNILKRHGVQRRRRGNAIREMSEKDRADLIARWTNGESKEDILLELKTSHATMNRWLKQLGFEPNKTGLRGEDHHMWKGGRHIEGNGYIRVWISPYDKLFCMANNDGYVMEHRLVMAQHLGRPLRKDEYVHHINGDKQDNRLNNLQLVQGQHGVGQCYKCLDCGSTNVAPHKLEKGTT